MEHALDVVRGGVAIGNEAIFSRRATLKPALLGMDLVRLGLERAANAAEALEVMTRLLEALDQESSDLADSVVIPGAKNRAQLEQNLGTGMLAPPTREDFAAIELALAS